MHHRSLGGGKLPSISICALAGRNGCNGWRSISGVADICSLFYNSNPLFLSVKIAKIYNRNAYGEMEDEDER